MNQSKTELIMSKMEMMKQDESDSFEKEESKGGSHLTEDDHEKAMVHAYGFNALQSALLGINPAGQDVLKR
jgi:hypothetical protein